jgi:hypothetical protein
MINAFRNRPIRASVIGMLIATTASAGCSRLGRGGDFGDTDYRPIDIEILASRAENEIRLSDENKAIDVTVLGSLNFGVLEIDDGTVRIEGAMPNSMHGRSVDYNNDRHRDYEYTVEIGKLKLGPSTRSICLTGALTDGRKFRGCGPVVVTP